MPKEMKLEKIQKMIQYLVNQFYTKMVGPITKEKLNNNVRFYFKSNDLYVQDDIIFLNSKIKVPLTMRNSVLKQLHESNFIIVKTGTKAHQILYWTGMNSYVENLIAKCSICEQYSSSNCKEPLIPELLN